MKNRFVVGIDSMSTEQESAFVDYLRSNGYGWWHWINNFWLVVDISNTLTSAKLRDDLMEIAPKTNLLVIQIKGDHTWAGFGPSTKERNVFNWLHNSWKKF